MAVLQSVCTAVLTISGIRLAIGLTAFALAGKRVCAGAVVPPGRDPDSYAGAGDVGSGCGSCGAGVDAAPAEAVLGAVADEGQERNGETVSNDCNWRWRF